jgi:hypothetical protein
MVSILSIYAFRLTDAMQDFEYKCKGALDALMPQEIPDVKILQQIASTLPPFPQSWRGMCFGCSKQNLYGLLMSFWPLDGGCFSKYRIPDYFCGFDGVAYGGIVASVLDETAAWAITTTQYQLVLTRKMEITFLKMVPTNMDLFPVSLVTYVDTKKIVTYSAIVNAEGTRLAEATADFTFAPIGIIANLTNTQEETLRKMREQMVVPLKEYRASLKKEGKKIENQLK